MVKQRRSRTSGFGKGGAANEERLSWAGLTTRREVYRCTYTRPATWTWEGEIMILQNDVLSSGYILYRALLTYSSRGRIFHQHLVKKNKPIKMRRIN